MLSSIVLLAAAQVATAHFGIIYPEWRADTLSDEETSNYTQWDYPCANVPDGVGNRTDWPVSGGSVSLDLHHPWTYVYINLGLGENVTNFNISLTPNFLNVTGNGTFCLPTLPVPQGISDGQNATIQVVTSGTSGSALYNCADITFRTAAQSLSSDECQNTTISAVAVGQTSTSTNSTNSSASGSGQGNSAPGTAFSFGGLASTFALAVMFAAGL